jgi:predicted DNA binding CopG/RHH family protein
MMAKMGRPKGDKKDRRHDRITIPLNEAEIQQIGAAAETSGLPPATFCRLLLLKATGPEEKKKK